MLLILTALLTFVLIVVLSRVGMLHKREAQDSPFIADIAHGICPRCGALRPAVKLPDPPSFWKSFSCTCGFTVKAHLRDRT